MEPDGIYRHTPTLLGDIVVRCISFDRALSPHISDAITNLANPDEWLEVGDSIADVVLAAQIAVEDYYNNMLVGSVAPWIVTPPDGWLLLDGSTYNNVDYPELSSILPTHLISGSTFTLPDVTNAFPFGVQDEDDATQVTGSNTINLSVAQLPAHTHTYIPPVLTIQAETPTTPIPTAGIGSATATSSTGSGDDIDIRPLRFGLVYAVFAGRV